MDLRRIALFFALSLLCIYLYSELVQRLYGPPVPRQVARGTGDAEVAELRPDPPTVRREPETAQPAEPLSREAGMVEPLPEGKSVVVETDLFRAEWTTSGARLERFYLKQYRSAVEGESPELELIGGNRGREFPLGVELLPLGFNDARVLYEADRAFLSVAGDSTGKILFRGTGSSGEEIEKEILFRGNAYPMDLTVRVRKGAVQGSPGTAVVRLTREYEVEADSGGGWFGGGWNSGSEGVIALNGRRLEQVSFDDLEEKSVEFSEPVWGGFGDQYFIGVALTGRVPGARVVAEKRREREPVVVRVEMPMEGSPAEATVTLYFGPKEIDILEAAAPDLERAVDFGIFWFIALPLLRLLKLSHVVTGNYGVDIIIVSTLIKVLFLPLTKKSMVSMQAMQKLQPEMAKIREQYKDDSQRLQKEMMELYRRHKVNPLSGCLPMLLQLPVFIGLYNTLLNSIELRHAPFVLWVTDLSSPERLMIAGVGVPVLAIAMGASMLVQQWMTPATGDPMQRRMMMLMPVMFTFMFINFPSGLVLYWLVNNLLTIAQQYVLVNKPQDKTRNREDGKGLGKSLLAIAQQHGLVKKPRGNNREKRNANRRGGGTHDR